MKKIFALALALLATIGVVRAQGSEMSINRTNGSTVVFETGEVENIEFTESGWTSIGYCLYGEDFIGSFLYPSSGGPGAFCCQYYVEVQEKNDKPGLYRLVNPYGKDYPHITRETFQSDDFKDYYIEIDATDPDGVFIKAQPSGLFVDSYGDFSVCSYGGFLMEYMGYSLSQVKAAGLAGTLKDGKITFPTDALMLNCSFSHFRNNLYYANTYDKFLLDLNDINNSDGYNNLAMQGEAMKIYRDYGTSEQLVGSVKSVKHNDSPWTSLGYFLYGEDFVGSTLYSIGGEMGDFCCDYYVEVEENTEKPGLYRLVNPYAPSVYPITGYGSYDDTLDYYIEIDATDPDAVFITLQDTGMKWDDIGHVWVYSRAAYSYDNDLTKEEIASLGYFGTLKDGVITFPKDDLYTYFRSYASGNYDANDNNRFRLDFNEQGNAPGAIRTKKRNVENGQVVCNNVVAEEPLSDTTEYIISTKFISK